VESSLVRRKPLHRLLVRSDARGCIRRPGGRFAQHHRHDTPQVESSDLLGTLDHKNLLVSTANYFPFLSLERRSPTS